MSEEITPREIESIRISQEKFMPSLCRIYRRADIDSFADYQPLPGEVKCRITVGFASLWRNVADKLQGLTAYTVRMPVGTDVREGDKLFDSYGREFMVRDVGAIASYHTALQVLTEMIDSA